MHIKDAAEATGCTHRAIKYYEEKGLLPSVSRLKNGYRDYTPDDLRILNEIQLYRKLGIAIDDIRRLIKYEDSALLLSILEAKRHDQNVRQQEIDALEAFIAGQNVDAVHAAIDYASIAEAIRAQLPGFFGNYLCSHFAPYLNISISTQQQREAYQTILSFWDDPQLRLPLSYRFNMLLSQLFPPRSLEAIDAALQTMLHPSEEEYARIKENTLKSVRMRENLLIRYSPPERFKRSMMRRLRDCGYYDVFLPAMEQLSPSYKAYREALRSLNDRICSDLNLYYDSDFNLRMKTSSSAKSVSDSHQSHT